MLHWQDFIMGPYEPFEGRISLQTLDFIMLGFNSKMECVGFNYQDGPRIRIPLDSGTSRIAFEIAGWSPSSE